MLRSGSASQHVTLCETSCAKLGVITSQPQGRHKYSFQMTHRRKQTTGYWSQRESKHRKTLFCHLGKNTLQKRNATAFFSAENSSDLSVNIPVNVPISGWCVCAFLTTNNQRIHLKDKLVQHFVSYVPVLQRYQSKMTSVLFITHFLLIYCRCTYKYSIIVQETIHTTWD